MKPTAILSWILILAIAVLIPISIQARAKSASTQPVSDEIDMQYAFAVKYLLGAARFDANSKSMAIKQVDESSKTPIQQVASAIVAAELGGKDQAIERLSKIESPEAASVRAWYESQEPIPGPTLERLDYFGRLAQSFGQPDSSEPRKSVLESARLTVLAGVFAIGAVVIAGILGFVLLVTGIVMLSLGKLQFRATRPVGAAHVYVEAFALYLLTYILGAILVSALVDEASMFVRMSPLVAGVLLAFVWPTLRGVRFSVQRGDWGIHTGKNLFVEMFWGVVGYLAGLPFIAMMAGITLLLVALSKSKPTHPIMTEVAEHPWLVFGLAVVFAPLTEELLFRGAFVSHLRASVGVVLSAVISGLIFASIHPQGWTLIPVLAGIGMVLAVIRQWRDTLVSSITAHALHNGVLVTLMILLMK